MTTAEDWIQQRLESGELTARDIADLTDAFQRQNALQPPDAKPGPQALGKARQLLEFYSKWDVGSPPHAGAPIEEGEVDEGDLPNLALGPKAWQPGIDISHHQTLKPEDLDSELFWFAFVKATEGTSGAGSLDPKMLSHLKALRDHVHTEALGIYHFARPSSARVYGPHAGQPLGEAQNFTRQWELAVEAVGALLPPVLDIEDEKPQIPEPLELIDWCLEWAEHCERLTGRWPIIYSYFSYINVQMKGAASTLGKYPLWLADYRFGPPDTPNGVKDWPWLFWQHSGSGQMPGVVGACDMNVFRGTYTQLLGLVR
jgi:GH25 family lysozyme M1 (1,4-beta-N-acetylmuramidase)